LIHDLNIHELRTTVPSQKNVNQLSVIKEKKDKAKSVVFADYRGLKANQINILRQKVKESGGEILVTKNTLLSIAFDSKELKEKLTGPIIAIFSYEDEVAPLKTVDEYKKTNELPTYAAGFLNQRVIKADEVEQLAKLPSKLELQAKVVGTIAAPLSGFVNVLQGNIRNLVYALNALKEKQSK
jgi:large subunit ribosomal protein L10